MKRLRHLLSYAIFPPFLLLVGLGLLFHVLGNALVWFSIHVVRSHLAFPIVLARRAIAGKPMWVPDDLQLGINPESPRARAAVNVSISQRPPDPPAPPAS